MGRGVSVGGGKSSLNYLFRSGELTNSPPQPSQNQGPETKDVPAPKAAEPSKPVETKQGPPVVHDSKTNNYLRSEGQNCGNFITMFLKAGGHFVISIKANCIDSTVPAVWSLMFAAQKLYLV